MRNDRTDDAGLDGNVGHTMPDRGSRTLDKRTPRTGGQGETGEREKREKREKWENSNW